MSYYQGIFCAPHKEIQLELYQRGIGPVHSNSAEGAFLDLNAVNSRLWHTIPDRRWSSGLSVCRQKG